MGHKTDAADIFIPIFFAETKSLTKVLADKIPIQGFDSTAPGSNFVRYTVGNGCLAGTAQPCKPDGYAVVLHRSIPLLAFAVSSQNRG